MLSQKQIEFVNHPDRRWNIKSGSVRSGKTYLDVALIIPKRLLEVAGLPGLSVLIGNTKGTLQRNVIEPLQEIFGTHRVSSIRSDNTAEMFGEKVFCLGADSKKHVDRLRGSAIKYCYGDEITTWNEEVFEMLKSRLDKPYSHFDGTCNPTTPTHWFKRFLDSDADIYCQTYTIDDNPFLAPEFVDNLKREYLGTVYYNRYILGQWVAAEGAIYKAFVDDPERFIQKQEIEIQRAVIGVDFGGGSSAHAFSCVGFTRKGAICVLEEYREKEALTPEKLSEAFIQFVKMCQAKYFVPECWCDSAEQTLINGLKTAAARERLPITIGNALKKPINDRIRALCILMGAGKFWINRNCKETIEALQTAVWSDKATEDVRLDNGTTNIDSLDAMEYAYEREIRTLVERWR